MIRESKKQKKAERMVHTTSSKPVCSLVVVPEGNRILLLFFELLGLQLLLMVVRGVIICSASQGLPSIATQDPTLSLSPYFFLIFLSLASLIHSLMHLMLSFLVPWFTQIDLSPHCPSLCYCPSFPKESSFFTCTCTSRSIISQKQWSILWFDFFSFVCFVTNLVKRSLSISSSPFSMGTYICNKL